MDKPHFRAWCMLPKLIEISEQQNRILIFTFKVRNVMIQQSKYCGIQISLFCHCILICISSQIRKFFMITQLASNASDASQLIIIGNAWTTTTWCMMHLSPPGWYANNEGQILYSLCLDALYSNWCWKHSLALLFSTTPLPANTLLNWHFIF